LGGAMATRGAARRARATSSPLTGTATTGASAPRGQGLTLAHFKAQLEDLRGHIAHVRAQLEHLQATSTGQFGLYGRQRQLKLSEQGQSKLKLSRNGNECKPLHAGKPARGPGRGARGGRHHSRAVQFDPMKPKLKPPGTERLKVKCDVLHSTSALKFNLRRHFVVDATRSTTKVGRCRLTLSNLC